MRANITRFKKISVKLTIFYALMFSVILIALSALIVLSIRYYIINQAYNDVINSSDITIKSILDYTHENEPLTDPDLLSESSANSEIEVVIADKSGQVVNASADTGIDITADYNIPKSMEISGNRIVVKNTRIMDDGKFIAYLQVTKNLEPEYTFLNVTTFTIGIADIFGIILSVLAGFLMSRRLLKPIDKITRTAKRISITDLSTRIDVNDNNDELSNLAKTFNEMIARLKDSFDKQNAFVSDASHELRTPISVIRGYIDLIDRWGKDDRKVLEEAITAIQNETRYMGDMVERLLFLARSDAGRLNLMRERFDLSELADEIINEYSLICPDQPLLSDIQKGTYVVADLKLIKQALRAVIDNGIKYSPRHEKITITSTKDINGIVISVSDNGIGIPEDKINEIFERFYRVDSARERKAGSAGLGLSIVQNIIQAHGGWVKVDSEPGKGTIVSIELPK